MATLLSSFYSLDFTHANRRLVGVDDSGTNGMPIATSFQLAAEQQLFFDMGLVSRAFEQLGGESVRQFAAEQYDRGWHHRCEHLRK